MDMTDLLRLAHYTRRPIVIVFILLLMLGLVAALGLTLEARPAEAGTLCVKPGGGNGCQASIQAAVDLASPSDTILVAAGSYVGNVFISKTVTLQGGWNETFSIRDLDQFSSTILPANNTQSVVAIYGISGDPAAVAPTVDGFVITGGRADLGSNHGGGLQIRNSNANIFSNTIKDNVAFYLGGGVWVQNGAPLLQGNDISGNYSDGLGQESYGGGMALEGSQATLIGNIVAGNTISATVGHGGGVSVLGSGSGQVSFTGNRVFSNTAGLPTTNSTGGGILVMYGQATLIDNRLTGNVAAIGGGLAISATLNDCCNVIGQNNVFRWNTADRGGGIFIGGSTSNCCGYRGSNTVLMANSASDGGGLYSDGQVARLSGSLIFSNTASLNGGGMYLALGASVRFSNTAAIYNTAAVNGGAVYNTGFISLTNSTVSGNGAGGSGGGVANFGMTDVLNVTVADNTSGDGAGFFNANVVRTLNSLIGLNTGDNCSGGLFSLGYNLEDGGTCALGQPTDMSNTDPSIGMLGDNGGNTQTHELNSDSPAIDTGDDGACGPFDQRGFVRPVDGDGDGQAVCDIGAYEFEATLPPIYLPVVLK